MSISVRNVSKRFGDFVALDDISLNVRSGSLTALLGPSGSGKSTLLRIIAGLESADAGTVAIDDRDVTRSAPQGRGVGFVFQHYAAFKHMTVADNIGFGLKIRKRPKAEIRRRVGELLELVQLPGLAERYPAQLSGGQRQRMGLARALAVEPAVLLLDEPFGALDAQVRSDLRDWLRRLHDTTHTTTVIVTHDQEEAMEVADEVVVMRSGRIEQIAGPQQLYEHPANEFVMSFVGQVNRVGEAFVRPHDVEITLGPTAESTRATVGRIVHLGFEVRVELVREHGEPVSVQLTRDEANELALYQGQVVSIKPTRQTRFNEDEQVESDDPGRQSASGDASVHPPPTLDLSDRVVSGEDAAPPVETSPSDGPSVAVGRELVPPADDAVADAAVAEAPVTTDVSADEASAPAAVDHGDTNAPAREEE